jgi:hypothetical protein
VLAHTTTVTTASTPTEPTEDDEKLSALAKNIRTEHAAAQTAMCLSVAHAFNCGAALIQAKAAVPSGMWFRWLWINCKLSKRTALRYIRIAKHRVEIDDQLT